MSIKLSRSLAKSVCVSIRLTSVYSLSVCIPVFFFSVSGVKRDYSFVEFNLSTFACRYVSVICLSVCVCQSWKKGEGDS